MVKVGVRWGGSLAAGLYWAVLVLIVIGWFRGSWVVSISVEWLCLMLGRFGWCWMVILSVG